MNKRVYGGWHGVSDHLHILLAVSYEPIEGTLACRFSTGEPLLYANVPENMFQILIRSKFAGAYFRKHIGRKFVCLNPPPPKAELTELKSSVQKKAKILERKRAERVQTMEPSLFSPLEILTLAQPAPNGSAKS